MHRLKQKNSPLAAEVLLAALLLAACQPAPAAPPASAQPSTLPGMATVTAAPTISNELHATDPATVSLASGKVQLVEFFAFW